jgi:hypothetical protein
MAVCMENYLDSQVNIIAVQMEKSKKKGFKIGTTK